MKTIITKKIDGFNIITGFDKPNIDPVATQKKTLAKLVKTDIFKSVKEKQKKIGEHTKLAAQHTILYSKANFDLKLKTPPLAEANRLKKIMTRAWADRTAEAEKANEIMLGLIADKSKMSDKIKELTISEAIYFTPRTGEEIIENSAAELWVEKVKVAQSKGMLCAKDGKEIANYKGKSIWKKVSGKWEAIIVDKIGEDLPANAVESKNLTEKQIVEINAQVK